MRLLCFHCAGGSSSMFKSWKIKGVEIIPLDLPGRGNQVGLPLIHHFNDALDCLMQQAKKVIDDDIPWGLVGHSMGALLGYEVSRRLSGFNPLFRILSGVNPLKEYNGVVRMTGEDNRTLIKKLGDLGGIPDELQKNPMFIKWFAPIIRADLSIVETFTFQKDTSHIPTYVINGEDDRIINKMKKHLWNRCMHGPVHIKEIKGGHFEILKDPEVIQVIMQRYL